MRFAILGAGMVAHYHKTAIEANADLGASFVAMAHYRPEHFSALSERFGQACETFDHALAREDVDAVCICTPSGQHAEQAIRAAESGKHVLVEKPMALRESDCDRMIAAAAQNGVLLSVALQRRVDPLFQAIHTAISQGDLGEITMAVVTMPYFRDMAYYNQAAWRGTWPSDGGGVLMNQGIHIIDLLTWFLGDPVDIQAHAGTLHRQIEVEDVASATLRFENGALATITATTTAAGGFPHRIEIYGTNGAIQVEGEGIVRWEVKDPALMTVPPPAPTGAADAGTGGHPKGISAAG